MPEGLYLGLLLSASWQQGSEECFQTLKVKRKVRQAHIRAAGNPYSSPSVQRSGDRDLFAGAV